MEKNKDPTICSLYDMHYNYKDTYIESGREIQPLAVLISDKARICQKKIIKDKERHYNHKSVKFFKI